MIGLENAVIEEDSIEREEAVIKDYCATCMKETTMKHHGDLVSDRDIKAYPSLVDYKGASYYICNQCHGSFVYKNGKRLSK